MVRNNHGHATFGAESSLMGAQKKEKKFEFEFGFKITMAKQLST